MSSRFKIPVICVLSICFIVLGITDVRGAGVKKRNVADLVSLSDLIVVGKVVSVSDGLDGNVPYTEITMDVSESIKGELGRFYTFRQFGLMQPRDMGNGYTNLNVTPDGWPRFKEGEDVVLFLYKAAALTGLRTTVGLFQGKFNVKDGHVTNEIDNQGLFEEVSVDVKSLSEEEQKLLQAKKGPMKVETFTSFVRKAVQGNWFKEK